MNLKFQALGRLGKGKPKTITPEDRQRRVNQMARVTQIRVEMRKGLMKKLTKREVEWKQ